MIPKERIKERGIVGKLAHTFMLKGLQALAEIDPPKSTAQGRLLGRVAKAVEQYEGEIYPMFARKKKTAKK